MSAHVWVLTLPSEADENFGERVEQWEDGLFATQERAEAAAAVENERIAAHQTARNAEHYERGMVNWKEQTALFRAGLRKVAPIVPGKRAPVTVEQIVEDGGGYAVKAVEVIG